jgi:hypothetical protein
MHSADDGDEHVQFFCEMCGMPYNSAAAARACEDEHLDEKVRVAPKRR